MYRPTFQNGLLSILYGCGSDPLQFWARKTSYGHVKRVVDDDLHSLVVEVEGTNVCTTYITCPGDPRKTLGIKLPFLIFVVKNLDKYFTFEFQVMDSKNTKRRIRASNYQSMMRVTPFLCTMPMELDDGWNQIQFNLVDFCQQTYGTNYVETQSVQIHANCRVRRVYFADRLYTEAQLPDEFKLYLPVRKRLRPKPTVSKPGEKKGEKESEATDSATDIGLGLTPDIPQEGSEAAGSEAASDSEAAPQDQPPSDQPPPEGESETSSVASAPEEGEPEV